MSALSEHAHDAAPLADQPAPPPRLSAAAWDAMVQHAIFAAWKATGFVASYYDTYLLVDAALRDALPALAPEILV